MSVITRERYRQIRLKMRRQYHQLEEMRKKLDRSEKDFELIIDLSRHALDTSRKNGWSSSGTDFSFSQLEQMARKGLSHLHVKKCPECKTEFSHNSYYCSDLCFVSASSKEDIE